VIKIESSSYSIVISDDIFDKLSVFLESHFPDHQIFILVDENTEKHCLPLLSWIENERLTSGDALIVPVGEESKSIDLLSGLAESLIELGASRKSIIINLGGGVVTDLGGFLASTFKRGVPFINVPTSLLAMVDASSGGKTGVNLGIYKNQLGTFCFPEAVFCGLNLLETLPKRELKSGYVEALKHGLIANSQIWNSLIEIDLEQIPSKKIIAQSIEVKNRITLIDPFEKGERKKLNFGHTIGHAVESLSHINREPLLHGEAIAIGIVMESFLSVFHAKLPKQELDEIRIFIFNQFDKYQIKKSDFETLIELMRSDKKNENEGINFTLLNEIGNSKIDFNLSEEEVTQALEWYITI